MAYPCLAHRRARRSPSYSRGMQSERHHHGHQHHHTGDDSDAALAELLDLDAEVLHGYLSELTAWVQELAGDPPARRILDLGSGTGTGTLALLRSFDGAEVTAVDSSPAMLARLTAKAGELGLDGRVRTLQADLDAGWPAVGPLDLVWAANSMHHMADPDRVLGAIHAALRPGGVLALIELDTFPRFLPDDVGIGRPGLEERCHAMLAEGLAVELPHLGGDWRAGLSGAGFTVVAERHFTVEPPSPLPAATGRYAQASRRRLRSGLEGRLSAEDAAALDTLVEGDGPQSVLRRDDLTVRAERTAWVARREPGQAG
jgi:SAM-dependent methyltransferase